jgi:hypothetical protein
LVQYAWYFSFFFFCENLILSLRGCFEQTSSVVYPMVLAQRYFLTQSDPPQDLVQKAKQHITTGFDFFLFCI